MNHNLIGSLSIAGAIALASVVTLVQSSSALAVWKDQLKHDAIDGCAAYSSYTSTSVKDQAGTEVTATDQYPISWMFDECMKNKGVEYERTDFSQLEPNSEAETEKAPEATDSAETE